MVKIDLYEGYIEALCYWSKVLYIKNWPYLENQIAFPLEPIMYTVFWFNEV